MIRPPPPLASAGRTVRWDQHRQVAGVCLVLAAITFAVFGKTLQHEFVNYDDDAYVYDNAVVARGLTLKGIALAFTQAHASNWHPLTWLSHMLDCQLYGLNPAGHHLTNVLLHTATVIALFLVLRQMTGALWRSAFVVAVFAIHPLRVESVAWVAERKDVLSGLFFMLTIGAYVRYARQPWSVARYGLVMLLFAMGLMSKPMLVTVPLVLLLLDYWPLQRVKSRKLSGLVLEKLPLLALSAASCVATLLAQTESIQSTESYPLSLRFGNALATSMIYLGQMIYPTGLTIFYPYPHNGLPLGELVLAGTLFAGLSLVAIWQWRKRPWLLAGWLWYLAMLLPVIGIIQTGFQAHADRYTYLPQIGIYIALTWLMAEWSAKLHLGRVAIGGLMTAVLGALIFCAWQQTAYWKNSETLWTHALNCTTGNYIAHNDLGIVLVRNGEVDEAMAHYQKALQIKPDYAEAHNNLGLALVSKGRVDEAIAHYQQAVQIIPKYAEAYINLGLALNQEGKVDEAIACFQKAAQINPNYAEAHNDLALILLPKGRVDEAIAHGQQAVQLRPDYPATHINLGNALVQKGRVDDAITEYQEALNIDNGSPEAHNNIANALFQKGKVDDAISHYEKALEINPNYAQAKINLAIALRQKEKTDKSNLHSQ